MNDNFTVLVNSSDGFEDCWEPFFTLYEKYWPQANALIFLNTETKNWSYPNLDLTCTSVQNPSLPRLTWSECLIAGLDQIKTPLVLYFQEDYFIHQPVRDDLVKHSVEFMMKNPDVKHIGLTCQGSKGPYEPYHVEGFHKIRQNARYRISTQAALWRVETLKSYLKADENGWMFEIYGTWRAHRRHDCFLVADFSEKNGGPAIDYLHTGIIKGKWLSAMQNVFKTNGIKIDYSKRGFYKHKNPLLNKLETAKKLLSRPKNLIKAVFNLY